MILLIEEDTIIDGREMDGTIDDEDDNEVKDGGDDDNGDVFKCVWPYSLVVVTSCVPSSLR